MSNGYIDIPVLGTSTTWQDPVASAGLLPLVGNASGDVRLTLDTDTIYVWNGTSWIAVATPGAATAIDALLGDGTATGPGAVVFTLATVNSNVGTFNTLTVNGKGLVTAASNTSYENPLTFTSPLVRTVNTISLTTGNLTDNGIDGIVITGGTNVLAGSSASIAQHVSDTSHNGYLSSTDWNTFNNKQIAGSYITALTGDGTASGPGSAAFTLAAVNSNIGSFGSASSSLNITVNAKGLITAASTNSIQITESQVTNLTSDLALKAPLASPTFTGTPAAPTASGGTNTTQIATTAFVTSAISTAAYTFSTGLTNTANTITANISTGLSGGQTAYGDTASGGNLTLSSTFNATKGFIKLGSASAYDETNVRFGLGRTSPLSRLDILSNGQATTPIDSSGIILENDTAAALGAQQYSPTVVLLGQGWGTTASTSQTVKSREYIVPVQGLVPTGTRNWDFSINGGAYSTVMSLASAGNLGIGVTAPVNILDVTSATPNINVQASTTSNKATITLGNGYGNTIFGVENSAGGGIFTGTSTGAAVMGTVNSHPVQFAVGSSIAGTFSTTRNLCVGVNTTPATKLQIEGPISTATSTQSGATYAIAATDSTVFLSATTGTQVATLPTSVGITGRIYTVKVTGTGATYSVATTSSQTIDGSTTYTLSAQYKYVTVQSDGANWWIIANN